MAQSVSLWGATYSNVPALDVPKDGGGTARFTDVTSTTAIASDVAQGKKFFLADGTESTGTAKDPSLHTVTITNAGDNINAYIMYNNVRYYSSGDTIEVAENDTIQIRIQKGGSNYLYINDQQVAGGSYDTVNYTYTVTSDAEIQFSLSMGTSYGYVTELSDIEALTITQNGTYTASGSTRGYSPVTVNVSGGATLVTKNITANGTYNASSDSADGYSSVTVNVSGGTPSLQNKTVTPTTSQQTVQADSGYDGLDTVTVNAMPTGTAGTPTATKGTVSNHAVSVTPSVTNATGFITGSTKTGTAVSVSASELVSGTLSLTDNGTSDCTNYASVNVNIPFVTYYTGSSTPASSLGSDGDIYLKTV